MISLGLVGVLLLGCAFGVYRYREYRSWQPARVDIAALQARAAQEQPVGGGQAETVAFLRSLGFPDQHIRIQRYAATDLRAGRLVRILGWIPQPEGFYKLTQIVAYCTFTDAGQLAECSNTYGISPKPDTWLSISETTPVPLP